MTILVTFATEQEFGAWRRLREFRPAPDSREGREYVAELSVGSLHVLVTGIGLRATRAHLTKVMSARAFDCVISSGLAGAVKPGHCIGQVLAAREICSENGTDVMRSDPELLQVAQQTGAKTVECFCSAARIAASAAEKQRLAAFADAVEMEGLAILEVAAWHGAKAIGIRAVSDEARQDLPVDLNRVVDEQGEINVGRALSQVVKNPGAVPSLIRFGRESWRARQTLARFLDHYVEAVIVASEKQQVVATR